MKKFFVDGLFKYVEKALEDGYYTFYNRLYIGAFIFIFIGNSTVYRFFFNSHTKL